MGGGVGLRASARRQWLKGTNSLHLVPTIVNNYTGRQTVKPPHLNESGLYDYAIKALGRHMRTEAELRRLMRTRVEPGEHGNTIIDSTIARLKENGYLDDAAYAEIYARLRQQNEKLGQRRVSQALTQKGVSKQIITDAVEARYADTDEESLARQYLTRKRLPKPESPKDTARVMRRLIAAGFSTSVIYKILRKWDVPDESLAALDNLEEDPTAE
jgi:regulatory protein